MENNNVELTNVDTVETTDVAVIDLESDDSTSNAAGYVLGGLAVIGAVSVAVKAYKVGKKGVHWAAEKITELKENHKKSTEVIDTDCEECETEEEEEE